MSFATKTALIVDDDEFFRIALRTVVTGTLGFSDVLEAENFDQATALLSGNKIDLAVFDLMMPGMAGPGSLKGVRDRFPDLCLVMATVSNRREDILLALQAGVNGYIAKSMGLKELSSALEQILGGKVYVPASIASCSITGSADAIAVTAVSDLAPTLTPPAERCSHTHCEGRFEQGDRERTGARRGNNQSSFGRAVSKPRRPQPLRGCRQRRNHCLGECASFALRRYKTWQRLKGEAECANVTFQSLHRREPARNVIRHAILPIISLRRKRLGYWRPRGEDADRTLREH